MLVSRPDGRYIDATVGLGGHAAAVLAAEPQASLLGIDADPEALNFAAQRLAPAGERVLLRQGNFRDMRQLAAANGFLPASRLINLLTGRSAGRNGKPSRRIMML